MNRQTYHQREMEQRVRRFDNECVVALQYIGRLQKQAKIFLNQLSCEPQELKRRFLQYSKQLDEFMYAVTEFNLSATTLETSTGTEVYDPKNSKQGRHGTTSSHSNTQRTRDGKSYSKREGNITKENKQGNWKGRSDTVENIQNEQNEVFTTTGPPALPPQPQLHPETIHEATIVAVDGSQLWVVADDAALFKLTEDMSSYYKNRKFLEDYVPESICVYYDEMDTKYFFRALYTTSENDAPEVFLVDTGEFQPAARGRMFPLAPQFAVAPPFAHLCYLADVEQTEDISVEDRRTDFLKQYLGQRHKIQLVKDGEDDNGVYVFLDDGTTVNERLVKALASDDTELNNNSKISEIDNEIKSNESIKTPNVDETITTKDEINNTNIRVTDKSNENINEINKEAILNENEISTDVIYDNKVQDIDAIDMEDMDLDDELDYSKCPEYENAVEAVAGYSNRDEMEICKHYKGGERCFKGSLCKKRHVKIHPDVTFTKLPTDGWTLDRVPVVVRCRPAPLPAPGTWRKVRVTHVEDTCRFYVHFECPEEPMSLANMVDEMTLEAENSRPLQLEPAPGELVSARFTDGRYYRARVIEADEMIEVMYIDYGNTGLVPPAGLRALPARWAPAPARAAPARLPGLGPPPPPRPRTEGAPPPAGDILREMILDKTLEALVVAHGYDEVTLKLVDEGFDVGEQLAAVAGLALDPYEVQFDSRARCIMLPA